MTALPLVFTAWGPLPGKEYENSIGGLCDLAKANDVATVALQVGQAQRKHSDQIHSKGLLVAAWGVLGAGAKAQIEALKPDVLIVQAESESQRKDAVACLRENPAPSALRYCVTSGAGVLTKAGWKELADLGVTDVLVEVYAEVARQTGNPVYANVERLLWQVRNDTEETLSSVHIHPVCGTYAGWEIPASYVGLAGYEHRTSLYLAEQMAAAQWPAWGKFLSPTPPPATTLAYWVVKQGAQEVHVERAKTYAPGDDGLGRALRWMTDNKQQIRDGKGATLSWVQR